MRLEFSKGLILKRPIQGFGLSDAMGCYPLFFCVDWASLHIDMKNNEYDLVSLTVVTDPFGSYNEAYLKKCFNSLVVPFKEHFVINLSQPSEDFVNKHNHRYAKKAIKSLIIDRAERPADLSDVWVELYNNLINRHEIKGISAFSEKTLRRQLDIPGTVAFYAKHEEEIVGITLWYLQDNVAYYHLGAYSDKGYDMRASYGIFWQAIEYFRAIEISWLDIGAGAGAKNDGSDGLSRFKKGWSTGTRTAYLCGHIFDKDNYLEMTKINNTFDTSYFPAYRLGEFD